MAKSITDILVSVGKDVFSEETLSQIEAAFNEAVETAVTERVQLRVEEGLRQQDEKHLGLLKRVVAAVQEDSKAKIRQVSESNAETLKKVASKYENLIKVTAREHRDSLFEHVSAFLDEYLEDAIPSEQLRAIAENRYAQGILRKASRVLGLNESVMSASVRDAILKAEEEMALVKEQNVRLKESLAQSRGASVLSEKVRGLPTAKRTYIEERLAGKPADFIERNFSYISAQFDKQEDAHRIAVQNALGESHKSPVAETDRLVSEQQEPFEIEAMDDIESGLDPIYLEGLKESR